MVVCTTDVSQNTRPLSYHSDTKLQLQLPAALASSSGCYYDSKYLRTAVTLPLVC